MKRSSKRRASGAIKGASLLLKAEQALWRLGVDALELKRAPDITAMLRKVIGPTKKIIGTLRFSTDPIAIAFLEVYDSIPEDDLERLPLEAICLKAEINPMTLFGTIIFAARNVRSQESALRAIVTHPDVVTATIKTAKIIGKAGDAARTALHTAVGFLPTKQGQNINVNLLGGAAQYTREEDDEEDDDNEAFAVAFPSISGNLENWGENRRKLLESGKK